MQIDLLVNSFVNDMARVATLQFTKSVGGARMNWLDIKDNHHGLSHEPDKNTDAVAKLTKINQWFAGELAYLVEEGSRAHRSPAPPARCSTTRSLFGPTNSARATRTPSKTFPSCCSAADSASRWAAPSSSTSVAHNRLHLALAHAAGHRIETFGKKELCEGGPLKLG